MAAVGECLGEATSSADLRGTREQDRSGEDLHVSVRRRGTSDHQKQGHFAHSGFASFRSEDLAVISQPGLGCYLPARTLTSHGRVLTLGDAMGSLGKRCLLLLIPFDNIQR
eukprot:2503432-Alexandrium_andersonii.AAC.1